MSNERRCTFLTKEEWIFACSDIPCGWAIKHTRSGSSFLYNRGMRVWPILWSTFYLLNFSNMQANRNLINIKWGISFKYNLSTIITFKVINSINPLEIYILGSILQYYLTFTSNAGSSVCFLMTMADRRYLRGQR